MALRIDRIDAEGATTLKAAGDVDLYSSPALRTAINKAFHRGEGAVNVDLRAVGYMDSSGVATLVEGLRAATKTKRAFILIAPPAPVMKVLRLSRLDGVFQIQPDE